MACPPGQTQVGNVCVVGIPSQAQPSSTQPGLQFDPFNPAFRLTGVGIDPVTNKVTFDPNTPITVAVGQAAGSVTASGASGGTTIAQSSAFNPQTPGVKTHVVWVTTNPSSGQTAVTPKPPNTTPPNTTPAPSPQDGGSSGDLPSIWLVVAGVLFLIVLVALKAKK